MSLKKLHLPATLPAAMLAMASIASAQTARDQISIVGSSTVVWRSKGCEWELAILFTARRNPQTMACSFSRGATQLYSKWQAPEGAATWSVQRL